MSNPHINSIQKNILSITDKISDLEEKRTELLLLLEQKQNKHIEKTVKEILSFDWMKNVTAVLESTTGLTIKKYPRQFYDITILRSSNLTIFKKDNCRVIAYITGNGAPYEDTALHISAIKESTFRKFLTTVKFKKIKKSEWLSNAEKFISFINNLNHVNKVKTSE